MIGPRESDEVVERDEAGVVVAVLESERLGEAVEEERFSRPPFANEQQRVLGDQRGKDDRLDTVVTEDPQRPEKRITRDHFRPPCKPCPWRL